MYKGFSYTTLQLALQNIPLTEFLTCSVFTIEQSSRRSKETMDITKVFACAYDLVQVEYCGKVYETPRAFLKSLSYCVKFVHNDYYRLEYINYLDR